MALCKSIKQDDGVTTNYHRILFIQNIINHHTSIAVLSYVDETSRTEEQIGEIENPYKRSITYETVYVPNMTTEMAYGYLKTLPEFTGATDI